MADPAPAAPETLNRRLLRPGSLPLRWRLVALLAVLILGALATSGLAATLLLKTYLTERQDAELRAARDPLVAAALQSSGSATRTIPAYVPSGTYVVHLQWDSGAHTDVFTSSTDVPNWPDLASDDMTPGKLVTLESDSNDHRWRVISGRTTSPGRGSVRYAVAVSLDSVEHTVRSVELIIAGTGLVVVLIGVAAGWIGIRRVFRPLEQIEDTAASIASGDLGSRVPDPGTHDEVASLARSLNSMLARIEESFAVREQSEERMRQFVQDASHELRTPLATVRGYAELYRQGAVSSKPDVDAAIQRIEHEATRMSGMVDSLLVLNRLDEQNDSEVQQNLAEPVDLTIICADAVQDARARDPQRTIRMSGLAGPVKPTVVSGDDAQLRQVVANLLGNAMRHSPADAGIEVAVGRDSRFGVVEVIDHGPGVPEDLRDRVFERFFRADASRNSSTGGSGLGLAIVAAIVDSHSGTVQIRESPGGGATFILRLPLEPVDA